MPLGKAVSVEYMYKEVNVMVGGLSYGGRFTTFKTL